MSFEIKEKPQLVERALLVAIGLPGDLRSERIALLTELVDLVSNLGIGIVGTELEYTRELHAKFLCGQGKAEEIRQMAADADADCLIFDNMISPSQQREWERLTGITVLDREEVILDIFAKRARTKEATLQVELARMQYALPRMTGMWKHLDRQRGKSGGSTSRGEGEKQIEIDRRIAHERIEVIRQELKAVRKQRSTQRKERERQNIPTAAIVGYTNAGKSSLLNLLSGSEVLAQNILFATLDTTSRKVELPDGQPLIMTDTVGFIRNLPHRLIEAFKSTLEEARLADFLIQVVDASDCDALEHYNTTCEVLDELGAGDNPMVVVWNKTDLIPEEERELRIEELSSVIDGPCILMSVKENIGATELYDSCVTMLANRVDTASYRIPLSESRIIAIMHRDGKILSTEYDGNDAIVEAILPKEFSSRIDRFRI